MTPLSRHPRRPGASPSGKPVARRIRAPWHVACLPILVSGCFYFGPIPTVMYNDPPEILRAEPPADTGAAVLIGPSGQSVFVLAADPDDDEVRFTWSLTGEGILGSGYPVYDGDGSQIDLAHDQELAGKTLTCFLDDGENALVELTWLLEVL